MNSFWIFLGHQNLKSVATPSADVGMNYPFHPMKGYRDDLSSKLFTFPAKKKEENKEAA